ncbi:maleylpyruvate isomerase N-terminal domain-containing protein [Candidatus Mycobacterium methanotrophicum]|uniref:Mycothiol-dependent maleylpyruvate isomerase metal-binding domain-containing protein n=1 Tax=Candidatus Mycobacterium methanotrophicum TaxID=2943498 RepID=A0ABY4QFQ5_9MYCO|nr:maleylpyruvate isomerase N-terminal domain-containing protein [Candidatus Mycobacterium methanotrophicum]UQX09830.1 hypothetical protein M5I08_16320 [Candidatus Mycobacterium methanotrophicum]
MQQRVDALIRGRTDLGDLTVPACPEWSVRQTVSHLAGSAEDLISLNLDGAGTDEWTRAQLTRLADCSLDELLAIWAENTGAVADLFEQSPKIFGAQAVFDVLTHEHDIRGAIGEPGLRAEDPVFVVAAGFLMTMFDRFIRRTERPALRLTTPTVGTVQLGDPTMAPARITLNLSDFEALRTFGGRRSNGQILALPWRGDAANLLPVFSTAIIRPPTNDLLE